LILIKFFFYKDNIDKFTLVFEYADGDTLNSYLNKYFNKLDWNEKYKLALQLASTALYLHKCGIVRGDLVI